MIAMKFYNKNKLPKHGKKYSVRKVESVTPYGYSRLSNEIGEWIQQFKDGKKEIPMDCVEPSNQESFKLGVFVGMRMISIIYANRAIYNRKVIKDENRNY